MHKLVWLGLSVIILSSLSYSIYADSTPTNGALELNLTLPLLRYSHHASGNLDLFVGAGYPVMANAGIDVYPWGGNKNFYIQLDCPLTYKLPGTIPESDEDYVPGADYYYQYLMPGISAGWKFYLSQKMFMRLGGGPSFPINIGSGNSEPSMGAQILAMVKAQFMLGMDL
jgi:hypothetical protein